MRPDRVTLEFGCNFGATAIVLAHLGAQVTAIDFNPAYVELARVNAERHGVADRIQFLHVPDTTTLPFAAESFDMITAFGVLDYVDQDRLPSVQQEMDRVLRRGGRIFVASTSNRLWPREVHSKRWLVNYLPRIFDPLFSSVGSLQRGVSPLQIRRGFGDYINVDLSDGGAAYLAAKTKMGMSSTKLRTLYEANRLLNLVGVSVGLCTPSVAVTLHKK